MLHLFCLQTKFSSIFLFPVFLGRWEGTLLVGCPYIKPSSNNFDTVWLLRVTNSWKETLHWDLNSAYNKPQYSQQTTLLALFVTTYSLSPFMNIEGILMGTCYNSCSWLIINSCHHSSMYVTVLYSRHPNKYTLESLFLLII